MPEEINRVLTDQISDMLFTTEPSGKENLLREGIAEQRIHFVGNVMIDTLRNNLTRAISAQKIASDMGRSDFFDESNKYAVVTMHRPSNVDDEFTLKNLLQTVATISAHLPVIFPLHPRTKGMIHQFGLDKILDTTRILQLPPMGYLEMLGLMQGATVVLTDSGGIQEETTALGVPCITLRNNTERPITVDEGTNTIAGQDSEKILAAIHDVLQTGGKTGRIPEYWDGHASDRIADAIVAKFGITKPLTS
jgi:UDP-N-acetylglucosamine 2-epimerase (non-hydrolysing)